jgi:hypothetical protein
MTRFIAQFWYSIWLQFTVACTLVSTVTKVKAKVTLWLAVCCQSLHLGIKPLETHDQRFLFNWTLVVIVLMWHPLWLEDWFVSFEYAWTSVKCTYCIYSILPKIFPLHYTQALCQYRLLKYIMIILHSLWICYNGSLITWAIISLTTTKFKRLIFLCLVSPCPILPTCSFSWFYITSACCLHNFVI